MDNIVSSFQMSINRQRILFFSAFYERYKLNCVENASLECYKGRDVYDKVVQVNFLWKEEKKKLLGNYLYLILSHREKS